MIGITPSTALWYASRATGVVALVLLTAVLVLGVLVNRQGRLPGLPRFAVTGLHRNISLLAISFLAVHIAAAIADPYVSIRVIAAVIPFTSSYRTLWLGLGAIALDLMIALAVTSLLRSKISRRAWRAVHWAGYAVFPVAVAHSLGATSDGHHGILLALTLGCCLAVAAAMAWRTWSFLHQPGTADRAAAAMTVLTAAPPGGPSPGSPPPGSAAQHAAAQHFPARCFPARSRTEAGTR